MSSRWKAAYLDGLALFGSQRWAALAVICALLAVTACWHGVNQSYPQFDAADYVGAAQHAYLIGQRNGIAAGLVDLYLRPASWRPTATAAMFVPGLLLSGGSLRLGTAINLLFFQALFLIYVWRLAGLVLKGWMIPLCVALIGTSRWMCWASHACYSEAPFLAFAWGTLYHLVRSEGLSRLRHAILSAFYFMLAILVRPVESVFYLGYYAAFAFALAARAGRIRWLDLLLTAAAVAAVGWYFTIPLRGPEPLNRTYQVWGLLTFLVILLSIAWRFNSYPPSRGVMIFLAFGLAGFLWYEQFAFKLMYWIWACSVGEAAKMRPPGEAAYHFIIRAWLDIFGWFLIVVQALTVVSVVSSVPQPAFCHRQRYLIIAASPMLLALLAAARSHSADLRFYLLPSLILTIATLQALDQSPGKWLRYSALCVITIFSAMQSTLALSTIWPQQLGMARVLAGRVRYDVDIASTHPDECLTIVQKLRPIISSAKEDHIACISLYSGPLSPSQLTMIAHEQGLDWTVFMPRLSDYEVNTRLRLLYRDFDRVIVGPTDGTIDRVWDAFSNVGCELVRLWKLDRLESCGFHLNAVITVTTPERGEKEYLALTRVGFSDVRTRLLPSTASKTGE